jgi:hypothetical protein
LRRHQKAIKAGSVVHFVSAVYIIGCVPVLYVCGQNDDVQQKISGLNNPARHQRVAEPVCVVTPVAQQSFSF